MRQASSRRPRASQCSGAGKNTPTRLRGSYQANRQPRGGCTPCPKSHRTMPLMLPSRLLVGAEPPAQRLHTIPPAASPHATLFRFAKTDTRPSLDTRAHTAAALRSCRNSGSRVVLLVAAVRTFHPRIRFAFLYFL